MTLNTVGGGGSDVADQHTTATCISRTRSWHDRLHAKIVRAYDDGSSGRSHRYGSMVMQRSLEST